MIFKVGDIVKIHSKRYRQYWYHDKEMVILGYTDYLDKNCVKCQCIVNYHFDDGYNLIQDVLLDYVSNLNERRLQKLESL